MPANAEPQDLLDWARQVVLQIHRWLPDRSIVLVADSAFAAIEYLAVVRNHVCVATRLRLDANLFAFRPPRRKAPGRPSLKDKPLKKLAVVLRDRRVSWQPYRVSIWYGRINRLVEVATGTALWYRGVTPVWPPISTPIPATSSPGSSAAGNSKSLPGDASASGRGSPGPVVRQGNPAHQGGFAVCSQWQRSERMISPNPESSSGGPVLGTQKQCSPSATRSLLYAAKPGVIRFFHVPSRRDSIEIPSQIWNRLAQVA